MKTRIFLFAASLCCFFLTQNLDAQVSSVNYQVKYDTALCRYDAYFIVNAGSAISAAHRTQFNAQFTLIVPTGDSLRIVANHNPLKVIDGLPISWGVTSFELEPLSRM